MRIKSEIWVKAYLRRCMSEGAACYVAKSGDVSAGAIYIRVDDLKGGHFIYGPAPAGLDEADEERRFVPVPDAEPRSQDAVDDYLERQRRFDPDLWIVELEDREARHFLGDLLLHQVG